jgi:ssDNA-binding Zn-finger/Zn-ribbon topoisomerase 1
MKLRKAKQGLNAGDQFWGCSTFPTCRCNSGRGHRCADRGSRQSWTVGVVSSVSLTNDAPHAPSRINFVSLVNA